MRVNICADLNIQAGPSVLTEMATPLYFFLTGRVVTSQSFRYKGGTIQKEVAYVQAY